ncbi:phosphatidylinositol-3-phosphatase SAC1 [Leptopilina boulardi]|uniref:phosphatidylinositol-3-phosphatase SAC1 n=1 Tax=Leptopilina boulardi TaxID=63433 RepID=UPI0021F50A21|nr:phosphatidylinositol-3-phosphatase SAC1 [Leptopilina boulardi]XP_051170758.1 phosphatidylinositol-3-phosphatase SAC1 [Leptopilina boulardi]
MTINTDVYDDLYLYATPEKFYIEPVGTKVLLVVDRVSQQIYTQAGTASQIPQTASRRKIWGIVGTIRLLASRYLIVITSAETIGTIAGQQIFKIISTEIIPYARSLLHLNERQKQNNATYLEMIRNVLNTPHFYFSYTYDLSHTMQRLHNTNPEFLQMPLYDRADPRFVWNAYMLQELTSRPEQHKFCLPIIHGFVSLNTIVINGIAFNWGIVSRRSIQRAGTRLFSRGIDGNGNVSNYVETEQLIEVNGDRSSFVQTRGSIPLFWQQAPNLKYKPKPQLIPHEDHQTACTRHFEAQIFHYGKQILVNLIDHNGAEGELERAYRDIVNRIGNQNVRLESFDFHAECRKMRWDRLTILMDRLAHDREQIGYFLLTRNSALLSVQDGVFRTNCIDCLDRTNVVQSMLAKRVLSDALCKLKVLRSVEEHPQLENMFKQVWADNADIISIEYSGTSALKTDFTRTGKRTKLGAIKDGINSMTRYYKNNFADGYRQDSIELFLGRYVIQDDECSSRKCPLESERNWRYATFPLVLLVASAMLVAHIILPSRYTTEVLLYMLFWGGMVAGTFATIVHHGKQYVDKPRLI